MPNTTTLVLNGRQPTVVRQALKSYYAMLEKTKKSEEATNVPTEGTESLMALVGEIAAQLEPQMTLALDEAPPESFHSGDDE